MRDVPGPEASKADWRRWIRDRSRPVPEATAASVVAALLAFIEDVDQQAADVMTRAAGASAAGRRGDPSRRVADRSACAGDRPAALWQAPGSAGRAADRSVCVGERLVLIYRAMPHELSLDRLADAVGWQRCAVTRTPPDGPLTLHPAAGATEQHRYGFPQPTADVCELQPRDISLALVPGMAFDRRGVRLGHGLGYYDDLLAKLSPDCPRIGVAPSELVVDRLPSEAHDIPMTHLATEHGILATCP